MQPLVDKVANRIPTWNGRLLNSSGRLSLCNLPFCAIPVHIFMALKVATWAVKTITTVIRGFLWSASEVASGGKCAVAWVNTCCPKEFGGLGVPNLQMMGMALRMRWLWFARTDPQRTWSGFKFGYEAQAEIFFRLPSRSRSLMGGGPCSSRITGFRVPPFIPSPPSFGGSASEGSSFSHC
jgi:hypothetical protein